MPYNNTALRDDSVEDTCVPVPWGEELSLFRDDEPLRRDETVDCGRHHDRVAIHVVRLCTRYVRMWGGLGRRHHTHSKPATSAVFE